MQGLLRDVGHDHTARTRVRIDSVEPNKYDHLAERAVPVERHKDTGDTESANTDIEQKTFYSSMNQAL